MKKVLKKLTLICLCLTFVFAMCSCESQNVGTCLTVDESFAGQRVMSFSLAQTDIASFDPFGLFTPKVDDITAILETSCPPELEMKTNPQKGATEYVFTLSFENIDEYCSKVSSLRGSDPVVLFSVPEGDIFTSGISIDENFTSSELFGWAADALKAKYPKYADKISFSSINDSATVVFNDHTYKSGARISVSPVFTPLTSVKITTTRNGGNDYKRVFSFIISAENLELIGAENFENSFILPRIAEVSGFVTNGWDESETEEFCCYRLTLQSADRETLERVTAAILPGSTIDYSELESDAFSECDQLSEHFVLSGIPCNADGTANAQITYIGGEKTEFTEESAGSGTVSRTETRLVIDCGGVNSADASIVSKTLYVISDIEVCSDVSLSGKLNLTITLTYPESNGRSGSERALRKLSEEYGENGLAVDVRRTNAAGIVEGAAVDSEVSSASVATDGESDYALVISCSGTPEEVSDILGRAYGEGNSFACAEGSVISVFRSHAVKHAVNIASLIDQCGYDGNITYRFRVPVSRISDVSWHAVSGDGSPDVLSGSTLRNTFYISSIPAADSAFTVDFNYKQLNLPFIVIGLLALVLLFGLAMWIAGAISRTSVSRRRRKKDDIALEAVKTVALANIPEEKRGEVTTLPSELTRRPTVVLQPRTDDGLNDEDDENEGVMLFVSTLRILLITVLVLFFFPFFKVQRNVTVFNISGWDNFFGKEMFGSEFAANRMGIVLLIVPVLLLILLVARRVLPKIVIPAVLSCGSLFCVYTLYRLQENVAERIESLRIALGGGGYITDPISQMAYQYSIVIYILLSIGGLLLLFADIGYLISTKRRQELRG